MRLATGALLSLALCLPGMRSVHAQQTVIYRCTDAKGAVTMQNDIACGPGMKQEIRRIGTLPTAPAPSSKPATTLSPNLAPAGASFELVAGPQADPLPASSIAQAERKPPPPLFQCTTWDHDGYLSENDDPEPSCAPLNTIGIGGNNDIGAGQACEMQRDTCEPVLEERQCAEWKRYLDKAAFRSKYAGDGEAAQRKADYDRIAKLVADSSCNPDAPSPTPTPPPIQP